MKLAGSLFIAVYLLLGSAWADIWNSYAPDQQVQGARVISLYMGAGNQPVGARFRYENGMTVDLLRFASVAQVSLVVGSLPSSNRGEPHTQEHLLIGKGGKGKYLNSLLTMSLADHTAGTYAELTNYQFYTAADKETFYRLLGKYLEALIQPDYTDEEVQGEVAHLGVVQDPATQKLRLEEKGTVYNEMVSSMEKSDFVNWYQLTPFLYGKDNPMAFNAGGEPAQIRKLIPEDIRRFHQTHYHFGSNLSLIAALPEDYSPEEFLARLQAIMQEVEPGALNARPGCAPQADGGKHCQRPYPTLAAYEPIRTSTIVIGSFPSRDLDLPQQALFAWKPLRKTPGPQEALEWEIFLSVLAEDKTSYLYRDLIDEKARRLVSGATGVGMYISDPPADTSMIFVSGLPPSSVNPQKLGQIRSAIEQRIREIHDARIPSELLREFNEKARSLISSRRRSYLKFIDSPPRFGFRNTGIAWHRHLDKLHRDTGFKKPLAMTPYLDALEEKLDSKSNIWKEVIKRAGLTWSPIVSAVKPDPGKLEAEQRDTELRLSSQTIRLARHFSTDEQSALARYRQELEKSELELAERDKAIPSPNFTANPPLSLDDSIQWDTSTLAGVGVTSIRFPSTIFSDIALFFDLKGVPKEDLVYLPVLPHLFRLGVTTRLGERLDYARMEERWRSEIYSLGFGHASNPRTGRLELQLTASAAGSSDTVKAIEWLENCIFRADISSITVGHLRALLSEEIRGLRNIFQLPEENWVREAADAWVYRTQPLWMSVESPWTRLHHLNRVYFRLLGYPDDRTRNTVRDLLGELTEAARRQDRATLEARFKRLAEGTGLPPAHPGTPLLMELGAYFQSELSWLPEAAWRQGIEHLARESLEDLAQGSLSEIKRLKSLLAPVLAHDNVRAVLIGNPENTQVASELHKLLAALPLQNPPLERSLKKSSMEDIVVQRLKERHPGLKSPAHVGLINPSTRNGTLVLFAPAPTYLNATREAALDYLSAQVFAGAAPHSFFLQTWSKGLAYSNGIRPSASRGRLVYYAERCPDLTATLRFVSELARSTEIKDDFFLDFALANSFDDYRGAEDFSSRGQALASDLADGISPDIVRRFKENLIAQARAPGALEVLRASLPRVLGSVLVGYESKGKVASGAAGFATGPEAALKRYGEFLRQHGIADGLLPIAPNDFWLD